MTKTIMTNGRTNIPTLSIDLVDMLNEKFPERSPELGQDIEEIMFKAGQRSVVRMLNALLKEAEEEALKNELN